MQWVEQRMKLNKPKLGKVWEIILVNKMFNQTVEKLKKEMTENPAENLQDFLF
jgi:hypothetical protein